MEHKRKSSPKANETTGIQEAMATECTKAHGPTQHDGGAVDGSINQLATEVEKSRGQKNKTRGEAAGRTRRRRRRAPSSIAACGAPPRRLGAPATSRCSPSLAGNSPGSPDRVDVGCARGNGRTRMGRSGLLASQNTRRRTGTRASEEPPRLPGRA